MQVLAIEYRLRLQRRVNTAHYTYSCVTYIKAQQALSFEQCSVLCISGTDSELNKHLYINFLVLFIGRVEKSGGML